MNEVLTRCGYRCDLCFAFRPNVEASPSNQQVLSDGWHKYFGFRIPAEHIVCDGCLTEGARLIDTACPVRPCVIARELDNCASCSEFGCEKLRERLVTYEEIALRAGVDVPPEDRARFILPYENKVRLDSIRARLS